MAQNLKHSVIFSLEDELSQSDIESFLKKSNDILSSIETVINFEYFKQISPKTSYDFVFSMEFESREAYDYYSNHSDHLNYVEKMWNVYVSKFLEIDYFTNA